MALSLVLDATQPRIRHGRACAFMQGGYPAQGGGFVPGWSSIYFSNTWYDPITMTLMLLPAPVDPNWSTTTTGEYARLTTSDYTLTSANWEVIQTALAGDNWLSSKVQPAEAVITLSTYAKNRGFFLAWQAFSDGSSNFVQMECGWNSSASGAAGVSLRFWSSGQVDVYKAGALVGTGHISSTESGSQAGGASNQNQPIQVMLIPCRQRELLVLSLTGEGFSHVFEDIDPTDTNPTITDATNFWWWVPSGQAVVQCAPLKFAVTGYRCSTTVAFAEPPTGFNSMTVALLDGNIFYDTAYAGSTGVTARVVAKDNSGDYLNDGADLQCRIKFILTGDGSYTPFVYAGIADYGPEEVPTTAGSGVDLASYATDVTLDVPDSPAGVTLKIEALNPAAIETAGASSIRTQSNRPLVASLGSGVLLNGRTEPPKVTTTAFAESTRIELEVRDPWKALEQYRFRDPLPLDNLTIADALIAILGSVGLGGSGTTTITSDPFKLPKAGQCSTGEWSALVEVGDTAADWVKRILETYAGTWIYGFRPRSSGTEFFALSPSDLGTTPVCTLYATRDAAITAGISAANAWQFLYRELDESELECEANNIRVTGYDPGLRVPIASWYPDTASQDPSTSPATRPANWLGEPRDYGLFDPAITTQAACDQSARLLFQRLTPFRYLAEIKTEMILTAGGYPAWRGDVVALDGKGNYRIRSFSTRFDKEASGSDTWQWRETTYCLERIDS